MSKAHRFYLIPATSGLCIQPTKDEIVTADINGDRIQQWIVGRQGANEIAFQNAETKQYLRARGDYQGARVNQRPEKQYWAAHIFTTTSAATDQTTLYFAGVQQRMEAKERELEVKTAEMQKKLEEAARREREALDFEKEARVKQEELAEKELELEAERKATKKQRMQQNGSVSTNGDDRHWLERFSRLQQRLETAQMEIERLRASSRSGDNVEVKDLRRELEAASKEVRDKQEALAAVRESVETDFKARRVHSATKEAEALSVGQRWAPPGFRAGRDSAITTGDVKPITIKTESSFLPRLR
ncbi:hypothetical protein BST61_g7071 [Cercospora zeina]